VWCSLPVSRQGNENIGCSWFSGCPSTKECVTFSAALIAAAQALDLG
jgi:hypothetical protein